MMLASFDYARPANLPDAVAALSGTPHSAAIAGGTGLLTEIKRGERSPALLVDLRDLTELRGITKLDAGGLRIGALTTLSELLADPAVSSGGMGGVVSDAIAEVGDPHTRHRATIGGVLAAADPGSDLAAVLLVLAASVHVTGGAGNRSVPVDELLAAGAAGLAADELITAVEVPAFTGSGAYVRSANRATLAALCGVAVTLRRDRKGAVRDCRVAVTGATRYPRRLPMLERVVSSSSSFSATSFEGVTLPAGEFVTDPAASAEYRMHLTRVLAARAAEQAVNRAT